MRGWRICKLAGIDVEINYSWLIILGLLVLGFSAEFAIVAPGTAMGLTYLTGFLTAAGLFLCLLAHELAHSLAALRYGVGVTRITLFLFGGVAQVRSEAPGPVAELVIAGVGPAASLLLAGVFTALAHGLDSLNVGPLPVAALERLGAINGLLAIFNLLPAFPLDGGRLLRAALWEWWGDLLRSTLIASTLGKLFGSLMVLWGLVQMFRVGFLAGVWFVALGWLLSNSAQQAYLSTRVRERLRLLSVSQVLQPLTVTLDPRLSLFVAVHQYLMPLHLSALPVARDGLLVGLLTAAAVRAHPDELWTHLRVEQVMAPLDLEQMVLPLTADLGQALDRLLGGEVPALVIVDAQGALAGLLTQEQLIAAAQFYGK